MKKILIGLGALVFLAGCNSQDASSKVEEDKLIPAGIDKEIIPFNLEETTVDADLIANVVIKDKVDEIKAEPIPYTVFNAEVIVVYKGDETTKDITIKQEGDSEWLINGSKMFETGEEYILFMNKTTVDKGDFWIIGGETGTFQVLDNDKVAKLLLPIDEFSDIEVDHSQEVRALKFLDNQDIDEDIIQVLNKDEFIQKIKDEVEK
ncbi:lipoprotein [Viridibacillus sp. NPDC093762]|uniref:lipoprotein n=1 Tax=Viridibacillus sp. NPDC093762 TaxID=3390720 RepID=UPI003D064C2D